jgi:hypothetical protein
VRFVPYSDLVGVPNVIVDGTTRRSTVLTLSHWPASATPPELLRDLSTEIVLAYLRSPEHHVDVDAVSNDHFDLDGFMGVWSMVNPDDALANEHLVAEVARAGDFARTTDRRAARVAFALGALRGDDEKPTEQFEHLLPRLGDLATHIEDHADLWRSEDEQLDATEQAFADGRITIDEDVELDLAVVTIDPASNLWGKHRFSLMDVAPCHPIAVHNRTDRFRVLYRHGSWAGLSYRFESWVQYQSRVPLPRVDLTDLAAELTALDDHEWAFAWPRSKNPPVPWLTSWQPSRIPFAELRERIESALRAAEVTFSPYSTPMRYG